MSRAAFYFMMAIVDAAIVYVERMTQGAFTGWCILFAAFGGYFLSAALHVDIHAADKPHKAGW